jgi:putative ABC transport system permease protein
MEKDVLLTLKGLHKVHPDDKRAFGSINLGKEIGKVTGFLTGMQFLTWFVGIATLIAGVFAIGNILLITVKERTKEIGIRRALGATPKSIRQQIILESVFLTTVAGMLGIIFGSLVLFFIDNIASNSEDVPLINPTVNIPIIFIAFATLIILGTLIGLIPAHMATIVKPIEALREE